MWVRGKSGEGVGGCGYRNLLQAHYTLCSCHSGTGARPWLHPAKGWQIADSVNSIPHLGATHLPSSPHPSSAPPADTHRIAGIPKFDWNVYAPCARRTSEWCGMVWAKLYNFFACEIKQICSIFFLLLFLACNSCKCSAFRFINFIVCRRKFLLHGA